MYTITFMNEYSRNAKICRKRGYDMSLLEKALSILEETGQLPPY
jgi:mRNA interferase YafQ